MVIFTKNMNMSEKLNSFLDVIFSRKSVRSYTGAIISKNDMEILLKAGMAAPSGRNEQPWSFIAVTVPVILEKLTEGLPYAKMLKKAGAGIIVCGQSVIHSRPGSKDLWDQDCAAATENILLAAEAMGLGAVWTALHPYHDRQETVRRILNVPQEIFPFCLIPIGYSTGEEQPKDKFDPAKVHWEGW
jgi:nitroreductase